MRLEHAVDIFAHAAQRFEEAHLLLLDILRDHALDDDAGFVQHGAADRDTGRELHTVDAQRQQSDAIDLLDLVGTDDVTGRDQFRQHHGDGLQRLDLFLVVLATRAVLHDQDAQHAAGAHDRHARQRVIDFLAGLGAIGELRMMLGIVERQRPAMGGDVADQTLADPQARGMDGRRVEALGCEQFQHLARPQQVDRADLGHHFVGDQAHDLAQRHFDGLGTRHRVPEPLEEHSRSGQGSRSLHGQTARCLSRMTTKLRSMTQAQTRQAAAAELVGRALLQDIWASAASMRRL